MAPLPANNTDRLFFDYVTGDEPISQEHTVMWRHPDLQVQGAIAAFQTDFAFFLEQVTPANLRTGWRVIRVRRQFAGESFSLPVPLVVDLAAIVGTGPANGNPSSEAIEWSWQGRSVTTGRRVDFSLYGLVYAVPNTFRATAGDFTFVQPSIDALNTLAAQGSPCAIDGTGVNFYPYVNGNYNSYWEREIRN